MINNPDNGMLRNIGRVKGETFDEISKEVHSMLKTDRGRG